MEIYLVCGCKAFTSSLIVISLWSPMKILGIKYMHFHYFEARGVNIGILRNVVVDKNQSLLLGESISQYPPLKSSQEP